MTSKTWRKNQDTYERIFCVCVPFLFAWRNYDVIDVSEWVRSIQLFVRCHCEDFYSMSPLHKRFTSSTYHETSFTHVTYFTHQNERKQDYFDEPASSCSRPHIFGTGTVLVRMGRKLVSIRLSIPSAATMVLVVQHVTSTRLSSLHFSGLLSHTKLWTAWHSRERETHVVRTVRARCWNSRNLNIPRLTWTPRVLCLNTWTWLMFT